MKNAIPVLLLFILSCSPVLVSVPKEVSKGLKQKYKGEIIKADKKIRIDGYYKTTCKNYNEVYECMPIMFFNDGSLIFNFAPSGFYDKEYIYESTSCGTYVINEDFINAQILHHDFNNSYCFETQYKILNDTTIIEMYSKGLDEYWFEYNTPDGNRYRKESKFVKLTNKPDSSFWMKEKPWFWADQQKYKEYMKNLKKRK